MSLYLCRRMSAPNIEDARHTILEATPEVLGQFVASCAKEGSQASEDAALMALANGAEVRSSDGFATWYRVQKPINFVPCPTKCDITDEPLGSVMYDGKTTRGPWACMSERGWEREGCGRLGAGYGQKYLRNEEGQLYISEGMSFLPKPYRVAT